MTINDIKCCDAPDYNDKRVFNRICSNCGNCVSILNLILCRVGLDGKVIEPEGTHE